MMQFIPKRYRVRGLKKVCRRIGKNGASLRRSNEAKGIAAKTVKNGVPNVNVTGRGIQTVAVGMGLGIRNLLEFGHP